MQELAFGTVVTASHLPQAMALDLALARHHPEARLSVLLLDPQSCPGPSSYEGLHVITPRDIAIPDFAGMTLRYSAFELANNVKPFLVSHLLRQGNGKVILLDADIFVTGRFDVLAQSLDGASFVLTPHVNRLDLLAQSVVPVRQFADLGLYNGGLWAVGASDRVTSLLGLLEAFLSDTDLAFADQRVLPLAAHLAGDAFGCLRDPGYNIAYWNLHERPLSRMGDAIMAGGRPAVFFHLSGYDPAEPRSLSRYWPASKPLPPLVDEVLDEYAALLPRRPDLAGLPYGYERVDGRRITPAMRRHFQQHRTFSGFRYRKNLELGRKALRAFGQLFS